MPGISPAAPLQYLRHRKAGPAPLQSRTCSTARQYFTCCCSSCSQYLTYSPESVSHLLLLHCKACLAGLAEPQQAQCFRHACARQKLCGTPLVIRRISCTLPRIRQDGRLGFGKQSTPFISVSTTGVTTTPTEHACAIHPCVKGLCCK